MNTQPSKCENICANISDKRIIAKTYKEFISTQQQKKQTEQTKIFQLKYGQSCEQIFFKRSHTDDQEVHEKMLNIIIRKMKIKNS